MLIHPLLLDLLFLGRFARPWVDVAQSATARSLVIEGLRGNTSYLVQVAAWTAIGRGDAVLLSPIAVGTDFPALPTLVQTQPLNATTLQVRRLKRLAVGTHVYDVLALVPLAHLSSSSAGCLTFSVGLTHFLSPFPIYLCR